MSPIRTHSAIMKRSLLSSSLFWLAILPACAGEKLTIGQQLGTSELPEPTNGGQTVTSMDDPPACESLDVLLDRSGRAQPSGADVPEVAGTWQGEIDGPVYYYGYHDVAAEMPRGPITLQLGPGGSGGLRFGSDAEPSQASSDTDPYLCSGASIDGGCPMTAEIVPGFEYQLNQVQLERQDDGLWLRAEVFLSEPWQGWCELQMPRAVPQPCVAPADSCIEPPPCDVYVIGPVPADVDLAECTVSDVPMACDWLAAIRDAPCVCAAEGCSSAGVALTLYLQLSSDAQTLRGRPMQAPTERDVFPLSLQRQ
jgi:hypothetical protein